MRLSHPASKRFTHAFLIAALCSYASVSCSGTSAVASFQRINESGVTLAKDASRSDQISLERRVSASYGLLPLMFEPIAARPTRASISWRAVPATRCS